MRRQHGAERAYCDCQRLAVRTARLFAQVSSTVMLCHTATTENEMDSKLQILQHSLGLDQHGRGTRYRNQFCTGPDGTYFADCRALAEQGLLIDHGQRKMFGGAHLFSVTPAGDDYIAQHSPPPPKLTRGQKRYAEYLEVADCFESFGHWLKYKAHQARHGA